MLQKGNVYLDPPELRDILLPILFNIWQKTNSEKGQSYYDYY